MTNTKERIKLAAAVLFARRGYAAVSVKDIAAAVNIKAPSIYTHYESKESLYQAILETIQESYLAFYDRMEIVMATARSYADVIDALFMELVEVRDIFIYYGFSLVVTEQFRDHRARQVYESVLTKRGLSFTRRCLDRCVARGWVRPFDTEAVSILYHNSVVVGTLLRTQEDMARAADSEAERMFRTLKQYMLDSVESIQTP